MPNIIMICPVSSQPRNHKRAIQLQQLGDVSVFAFRRGLYEESQFDKHTDYTSLGPIEDGKYSRRIATILRARRIIRKSIREKPNAIYYATSLDCLIIARSCGIKTGFYEVGDLRTADGSSRLYAKIERTLISKCRGLILTSKYFYENYYKSHAVLPKSQVHVIDNKLSLPFFQGNRPETKQFPKDKIRIGLIGRLRYLRPIEQLIQFVQSNPDRFEIVCHGDGQLRKLIEDSVSDNIHYHGSFKYPDDIPAIYDSVDVNFVVYDSASKNVRLAIPNKLFESAYFGVPILCCTDTAVGAEATEWGIGKSISIESQELFDRDMNCITRECLAECSKNCFALKEEELLDDGHLVVKNLLAD